MQKHLQLSSLAIKKIFTLKTDKAMCKKMGGKKSQQHGGMIKDITIDDEHNKHSHRSKLTSATLLCPWERHIMALSSAWESSK